MLIKGLTPLGTPEMLTRKQRVYGVAGALILSWRLAEPDNQGRMLAGSAHGAHILYDVMLAGEDAFIRMMKEAERRQAEADPTGAPSLNHGMSDAEYGEVFAVLVEYVHKVARKGMEWRRRRDSRM